jgi:holliday junction DNA helicase RuvB
MRLEVAQTIIGHMITIAQAEESPLDNILLYGSQALSEKVLAYIHGKIQTRMRVISPPSIERPGDLAAALTNLRAGDILYVDELHMLNEALIDVLYGAIDRHALDLLIGKGHGAKSVRLKVPQFTLIAATTQIAHVPRELYWLFSAQFRLDD